MAAGKDPHLSPSGECREPSPDDETTPDDEGDEGDVGDEGATADDGGDEDDADAETPDEDAGDGGDAGGESVRRARMPKPTPEEISDWAERADAGESISSIARSCGRSISQVHRAVRKGRE